MNMKAEKALSRKNTFPEEKKPLYIYTYYSYFFDAVNKKLALRPR